MKNTTLRTMVTLSEPPDGANSKIQIMRTGSFQHAVYGEINITQQRLEEIKRNFDDDTRGIDLAIDLDHRPGDGAVGWIKELEVRPNELWAKVQWTQEGEEAVKSGKYRYFSPEFATHYTDAEDPSHKDHGWVLLGGGLTNRPFLKKMEPVTLSEDTSYSLHVFSEPVSQDEKLHTAQRARSRNYHIGIKPDTNLSMPEEYRSDGLTDEDFADPVNYRYPVTPEYVMAAYRFFKAKKNQDEYTPAERKIVASRIVDRLPEDHKADARTEFDLSEDTKPVSVDGTSVPHPADDVDSGKFHENPNGGGTMPTQDNNQTVSLSEFQSLQAKLVMVEQQNKRMQFAEFLRPYLFSEVTKSGKITPAQMDKAVELMIGLDDAGVAKFKEFISEMPDSVSFKENGVVGGTNEGDTLTFDEKMARRADEIVAANPTIEYGRALVQAEQELRRRG